MVKYDYYFCKYIIIYLFETSLQDYCNRLFIFLLYLIKNIIIIINFIKTHYFKNYLNEF